MQGITCTVGDACQATLIQAVDDVTLRSKLAGAGGTSLTLFQYLPLVSDNQFWARLRVFRVSLVQEKLESKEVARMVHVSMLPKSERDSGGAAWLSGSPSKLEEEVRLSFAELRGLWTRVNADAAANGGNAQKAWGSLPKVPAEMDGWIFHCGGMFGCSREHILNLGTSRVWISHPARNKAVSLDRETAASAANVVNYDFPDSTP
jgi:hypothetical protein